METKELEFQYQNNWAGAKGEVANMRFPTDINLFRESPTVTKHYVGRHSHSVKHYEASLGSVYGFSLEASYTICEECSERVISQKFLLFNHKESSVYVRELVSKGDKYTKDKY